MIRDAFLYVILLFIVGISLLIAYIAFDEIDDAFQASEVINGTAIATQDFHEQAVAFPRYMDFTFLTVFVAVAVAILILAWVIATNPALFFAYVVIIAILGGFAGYLANAFDEVILNPTLGKSAASFPIMSFILSNYLVFVVVIVFLMLIVFFAKPNTGGGL